MTFQETARSLWERFKEHPEIAINSLKEEYPDITPAESQQLQQQLQKAMYCRDKGSMDKEFKKYADLLKPIKARNKRQQKGTTSENRKDNYIFPGLDADIFPQLDTSIIPELDISMIPEIDASALQKLDISF